MKRSLTLTFLVALMSAVTALHAENMQAYFANFTNPATLEDVNSTTAGLSIPPEYASCAFSPPNVVFTAGFTSGLAYRNTVLYGLSWQGTDISLYSFSPGPCATGTILSTPLGLDNLESLAYCPDNDMFYSADFDFPAHLGQLVRIDPLGQSPTLIGAHMAFDVRITGMHCDSAGQLWAVTPGHGGRVSELLKINKTTGVETVVGATGIPPGIVESLAIDRDKLETFMYIGGSKLYRVDKQTGGALLVGGTFNKIWAMAGLPRVNLLFENGFETP